MSIAAGLLVASYLAWLEQFKFSKSLTEGFPLIVLAEQPIETAPFVVQSKIPTGSVFGGHPAIFNVGTYTALRLRVGNRPVVNTDRGSTRINARVSFFDDTGARLVLMDGRWAESPQMGERSVSQDYVESLSVPFPVGAERSLDIAFQRPGEKQSVAVNNDNFRYEKLEMPGRGLEGVVTVVVELNGHYVKTLITFKMSCEKLGAVGNVKLENKMPQVRGRRSVLRT